MASEASRFGHRCAVRAGADVGAGDVEVDVIYITFTMSAQYTGYLVPYKDKVQPDKCTAGQLKLGVLVALLRQNNVDREVLNPSPCE